MEDFDPVKEKELMMEDVRQRVSEELAVVDRILAADTTSDASQKKLVREMMRQIIEENKYPGEAMKMTNEDLAYVFAFGHRLFDSGNYKDAYQVFNILDTLYPLNSAILLSKGACKQWMKKWEEAVEFYLAAAFCSKKDPVPLFYCYECYMQLKEPALAGMMLCNVIARCGDNNAYHAMKAKSELMLERLKSENLDEPGDIIKAMREKKGKSESLKKTA